MTFKESVVKTPLPNFPILELPIRAYFSQYNTFIPNSDLTWNFFFFFLVILFSWKNLFQSLVSNSLLLWASKILTKYQIPFTLVSLRIQLTFICSSSSWWEVIATVIFIKIHFSLLFTEHPNGCVTILLRCEVNKLLWGWHYIFYFIYLIWETFGLPQRMRKKKCLKGFVKFVFLNNLVRTFTKLILSNPRGKHAHFSSLSPVNIVGY